jgi:CO/xanthine dehydrogenase FAD-binding subunit
VLALNGEVRARSVEGTRTIAAEDFFLGALETALRPGEWVEEVSIRATHAAAAVEEFAQRHGDYALCGVIAVAGEDRVTLVHFGIGALAVRTTLSAPVTVDDVREALADVDMTDDLHASSAYRRHLAAVLGARAASRALA